ncbi:MAG TPA: glucose-6-phosphate isomerase [Candidatus Saccharimonadia bacterium]|nr:glucose-6-phosphate isomerase [Candidatus Saccharimonadia bacterium]
MNLWQRYQKHLVRYPDLGISLDISRMNFPDDFFAKMKPLTDKAFAEMKRLEAGAIANPDEGRMVGHYWLRNFGLAPTPELRAGIESDIAQSKAFADEVHAGNLVAQRGGRFTRLLVIGIGGSALGPQFITDALVNSWDSPLKTHFFDNTDPDGLQRVLADIGADLNRTLTVVISKSGGTPETRNGMLEAKAAYERAGLDFAKHAVAVTGTAANGISSKLEATATEQKWLKIFPMTDWVGGRTSIMHTVGLVPMALQGVDVDSLLAGASAMDEKTRSLPVEQNAAMLLALMWHHAGGGKGAKDMVILPYKDRLVLLSKYLQQLVMESLGKELDLDGAKVNQGIAVYGNKGSTDQHAYVQQLRDGVNNFFATFIEVRKSASGPQLEVEPSTTCGDFLQGFLRGTRKALFENDRESVTISIPGVNAHVVGSIIALFERAVGYYATLVNVNAYHQPGVEAGKKAAGDFLKILTGVRAQLAKAGNATADEIAAAIKADPEEIYHCLVHLAANEPHVTQSAGGSAGEDRFTIETHT